MTAPAKPAATTKTTTAERPSLDYEMDMLRRARAEELERESQDAQDAKKKAAAAPKAEDAPKAVEAIAAPPPPAAPVIAPPPPATPIATASPPPPAPAVATAVVATPAATPPATAPAMRSAEATAVPSPEPSRQSTPAALTAAELPGIATPDTSSAPHATVLLVLDTDDGGGPAKPDPIICLAERCWISNGIEAAAKPLPRSEAVALKSTDSPDMDSCSGKSACVFRDIAVAPDAQLQVVELGEGHGAATGGTYTVVADTSCRKDDGALVCDNALVTHDFRIWMVPEATAKEIGVEGLEDAVAAGLPNDGVQPANDK